MRFKNIQRLFKTGSVCVFGAVGSGKDLLMSNVAVREKRYISNVQYDYKGQMRIPLAFSDINIPNDYNNFNSDKINRYIYPYPEGVNMYISDINVVFPSDYDSKLCKDYPGIPTFWQLHRHLMNAHLHWNTQNLTRVWKKVREHSDYYVMCVRCRVIFGIVIQRIRIYDKYSSAENKVLPFRFPVSLKSKDLRKLVDIEKAKFVNQYGMIKSKLLIYRNRSCYNSRFYKMVLENGAWER